MVVRASTSQWTPRSARTPRSAGRVRSLKNVLETKVVSMGVDFLYVKLVSSLSVEARERLHEVPRNLRSFGFLRRLLKNEVMLKSVQGNEVSAAQRDLRHLSVEQLLHIRHGTMDFSTDANSHSAHCNFLRTVELHMFEKLAQRYLRGSTTDSSSQLWALGLDLATMLGAQQILAQEENFDDALPPLSPLWGFKLDESNWSRHVALLHTSELWVEIFYNDHADFSSAAAGNQICAVCDRTIGIAKARWFDCDVIPLNPTTDDVVSEMSRVDKRVSSNIAKEMEAMQKVRSMRLLSESAPEPMPEDEEMQRCKASVPVEMPAPKEKVIDFVNRLEQNSLVKSEKPRWKVERDERSAEKSRKESRQALPHIPPIDLSATSPGTSQKTRDNTRKEQVVENNFQAGPGPVPRLPLERSPRWSPRICAPSPRASVERIFKCVGLG